MSLRHLGSGKVRELYEVDDDHLLIVASDRISAFDVIMAEPIPGKGRVLTAMTVWWLDHLVDLSPSHLVARGAPPGAAVPGWDDLDARSMVVRRAEMLPLECIVRGYLAGSAWAEYRSEGTMHGGRLPAGLRQSEALPEPVFTPSTKPEVGHDLNITFAQAVDLVGTEAARAARDLSLAVYRRAAARALERGIIIADTKLELGWIDGRLAICDEVATPDSSRFWPADAWKPGTVPPAFDKQPLRDWLEIGDWDKTPPPPALPDDVVAATSARYADAYHRITGLDIADWPAPVPSSPRSV